MIIIINIIIKLLFFITYLILLLNLTKLLFTKLNDIKTRSHLKFVEKVTLDLK